MIDEKNIRVAAILGKSGKMFVGATWITSGGDCKEADMKFAQFMWLRSVQKKTLKINDWWGKY